MDGEALAQVFVVLVRGHAVSSGLVFGLDEDVSLDLESPYLVTDHCLEVITDLELGYI